MAYIGDSEKVMVKETLAFTFTITHFPLLCLNSISSYCHGEHTMKDL
jgi:hypothetical protein